jgi:hypothetical protein
MKVDDSSVHRARSFKKCDAKTGETEGKLLFSPGRAATDSGPIYTEKNMWGPRVPSISVKV